MIETTIKDAKLLFIEEINHQSNQNFFKNLIFRQFFHIIPVGRCQIGLKIVFEVKNWEKIAITIDR